MIAGGPKAWILAARPKTLPAAVVPVWAGCVLVWKVRGSFDLGLACAALACAVCLQIATNFFNDAIDAEKGADTAERLGPVRVTASGLMSQRAVMVMGGLFLILAGLAGLPILQLRGWIIVAIGLPCLFLAYGYTGGPFPLAYLGLGELFVILFFGLVAVVGTVFVQTGEYWGLAALLGLVVGCLSAVLISINNLRDVEEDESTGKRTLAVRLGWRRARWIVLGEVLIAVGGLLVLLRSLLSEKGSGNVLMPLMLLVAGGGLSYRVWKEQPSIRYNRLLMLAGLLLLGFGAVWHIVVVKMG